MYKLFSESIKQSFINLNTWYWGTSFSSYLTILFILERLLKISFLKSALWAVFAFLIVFILRFIFIFSKNAWKHILLSARESLYGEILIVLKDVFAQVHAARKFTPEIPDEVFIHTMRFICDQLKKIFDKKTKSSSCSIAIKVLKEPNDDDDKKNLGYIVSDLCQDYQTIESRGKNVDYVNMKFRVYSNTCFTTIMNHFYNNQSDIYFFSNSLPGLNNYADDSFNIFGDILPEFKSASSRRKHWKLPYKSQIVVPITPAMKENLSEIRIIGFISVDCGEEFLFEEKYDIPLLQGLADGIYDLFEKRISVQDSFVYYKKDKNKKL